MIKTLVASFAIKRAKTLYKELHTLLPNEGTILDYGCGIGYFGHELECQTSCILKYLDVKRYPFTHPDVSLQCYGGEKIPYEDHACDHSMSIFTLHHTNDAYKSLQELIRVTRKQIVVCEDLILSPAQKYTEVLKDLVTNCFFTTITMQYKLDGEWEEMFSDLDLIVLKKIYFSTFFFPFRLKHVAWLLEKK